MNSNAVSPARLDYLDATRAFALVLGVVFHASLSFMPIFMGWAVQDISTGAAVTTFVTISHSFRMELFFLLAGFFGCVTLRRKSVGEFVRGRFVRIVVPFVVGWFLLRPLLVSGWLMGSASLRGDYEFWAGIVAGFRMLETLPAGIFTGSHLWFLYYLTLLTAMAIVARTLVGAAGAIGETALRAADAVARWTASSALAIPVLAVPTAAALWFMRYWGMDTPDQSLAPHGPVLAVYVGFFGLGWLVGRGETTMIEEMSRLSADRWLFAGVGIAGVLWLGGVQGDPAHPNYTMAKVGFALSYAAMMWSLVFLTMGAFRKVCVRPRAWIRYVTDSSYWMYLVHLPIVVWLQVAIAEVALHWSVKLGIVSVTTVGIALVTYDLFVRSTWVGWVLNGRRRERATAGWWGRTGAGARRGEATTSGVGI
jgi:Predicted acyltransferases